MSSTMQSSQSLGLSSTHASHGGDYSIRDDESVAVTVKKSNKMADSKPVADAKANLTSALEAAGDKASRTGFLSFMRILAVGYPGTDESFRAFLEERPSICLTFSEISDHVTTLVQVGERGRFCRAFFAGLEDGIYNLPERSPAAAAMPMPVAALTDGMPSTKHETT